MSSGIFACEERLSASSQSRAAYAASSSERGGSSSTTGDARSGAISARLLRPSSTRRCARTLAQAPDSVTIYSVVSPEFTGGRLAACQVHYRVAHPNFANFQGGLVVADGSMLIGVNDLGAMYVGLKRGLATPRELLDSPASVYLRSGTETNAPRRLGVFDSDTPGFRNFAYPFEGVSAAVVGSAGVTNSIEISYESRPGGLATRFEVDIATLETNLETGAVRADRTAGERLLAYVNDLVAASGAG